MMVRLPQPYRNEQYPGHSWRYLVGDPHQGTHQPSPPERGKGAGVGKSLENSPSQVMGDVGKLLLPNPFS